MKKITFLLILMMSSLGFAQNLITNGDFANGTTGWTFGPPGVVLNGEAYYSTAAGANPWDTELKQTGKSFIGGNTYTLTFRARAAANRNISVNIQNTGVWTDQFRNNAVALTTTMTDYSYVFVATSTNNNNAQLNFHMANMGTNTTAAVYIDDVTLTLSGTSTCNNGILDGDETAVDCGGSCAPCPAAPPAVAAPTPPNRNAADVISLFSGAYSNITINDWNAGAGWGGGATITDVLIDTNPTKKIVFGDYIGVDFGAGNHIDATAMTSFHLDFWIPSTTDLVGKVLNPKLVQFGGGTQEVSALLLTYLPTEKGTWASIDAPLSTFAGNQNRNDIAQFLLSSNLGTVYVDNIYLYKGTALGTASFAKSGIKMYPNPVKNILNIEANSYINKVSVYNILGQEVLSASPKSNSATLQTSELSKGVYMVTTDIDGNISTSKFIKE